MSKRYPRGLVAEAITGNGGYPLDRGRSTGDNGTSIVKVNQQDIEIDNRWIVPYCPIILKDFQCAHQ